MSRVWAYIISKELNAEQLDQISYSGKNFISGWTAHEQKLTASFEIFKNKIIIIKVNEDITNASGCSIDKLTRFIKETESQFEIELLNRFLVAYKSGEDLEIVHSSKVKELLNQNVLSENTVILNTSIANENELNNWEQPLKTTWLNKYLINV